MLLLEDAHDQLFHTGPRSQHFFLARQNTWKQIVERAVWWGHSVKERSKRTIGLAALTFEQLSTLPLEISAAVNSRPLCTLSKSPGDLNVLSPGHFLHCS
uniref:Uncharacterized protein n=1 Tax=Strigamia maritima TaxID=126957 RepID=T1IRN1_STRMM